MKAIVGLFIILTYIFSGSIALADSYTKCQDKCIEADAACEDACSDAFCKAKCQKTDEQCLRKCDKNAKQTSIQDIFHNSNALLLSYMEKARAKKTIGHEISAR